MKKVSTATRKAIRNFSQPKLTIGLDLGDRTSWYCLLDEVGEVLREQKLSTTPKAMREVFGNMPRCRIALETGMHSPWVSRLLSELGHEVIVAHARNVRFAMWDCNRDGGTQGRANRRCTSARKVIPICARCWCRGRITFWARLEPTAICGAGA
jgi:hypothetical protein